MAFKGVGLMTKVSLPSGDLYVIETHSRQYGVRYSRTALTALSTKWVSA